MRIVIETDSRGNPYCKVIDSDDDKGYRKGYTDLYRCEKPVLYKVRNALADVLFRIHDKL